MLPLLKKLIHTDQRGFLPERRISVNIRKLLDVIEHTKEEKIEAVVISCDFQKAFDRINFNSLFRAMEFFNFANILVNWSKIVYNKFVVRVQNNGYLSDEIDIGQGLHQGGPSSSLYFLIIAEILAIHIRKNKNIKGIYISDILNLLNQFADDLDVFSEASKSSVEAVFKTLDWYYFQTGLEINYDKTTVYRIGSLRTSQAKLYTQKNVRWSSEDITVLGVNVSHDNMLLSNYEPLLDKTKKCLGNWTNRGLSLMGKITVVNTLVASLYVYKMMVLCTIPDKVVKTFESIVTSFIWNNRKAKISLRTLQKQKSVGGLNLVNLKIRDIALKTTWVQILDREKEYAQMTYCKLHYMGYMIWKCYIHPADVKQLGIKNNFWNDTLLAWCNFNYFYDFQIENQVLWCNSRIRIDNSIVFYKHSFKKGLIYIYQLFENGQAISALRAFRDYGLDFVSYNGIMTSIPNEWKNYFKSTQRGQFLPLRPHNYESCLQKAHLSSFVYKSLTCDCDKILDKKSAWIRELNVGMSIEEFLSSFRHLYRITNVNKYRSFQYRILNRAIICNRKLFEWKIIESPVCVSCNNDCETVEHIFWGCEDVKSLWSDLNQYVLKRFQHGLSLSYRNIMFNQVCEKGNQTCVTNFLCLFTKQYIYQKRCVKGLKNFVELERRLCKVESMEKYIAIANNMYSKHIKKWEGCTYRRDSNTSINEY